MEAARSWKAGLVCIVLMGLLAPAAWAFDGCGVGFLIIENDPNVVIDCEVGYTVVSNSTVNLLPGAHISDAVGGGPGAGVLTVNLGSDNTINIYGGQIDAMLNTTSFDTVTVFGTDFALDGVPLEGVTQLEGPIGTGSNPVLLTGTDELGGLISLPLVLESGFINLNTPEPPTAPEIVVYPALLEHDFGDVEVGQPQTCLVQIYNFGNADLTVDSVTLTGSVDFKITAEIFDDPNLFPLVIAPSDTIGVDIEITYTPSAEGYADATVSIVSDDEDEPFVEVALGGVGIITQIPPAQQIQNILDYLDSSVEDGLIVGYGPGRCNKPEKRLKALRHMIKGAGTLIDAGYEDWAVCILKSVAKKTDGEKRPPDFVVGDGVAGLNQMVNDLIGDLSS